jgi:3-phytase
MRVSERIRIAATRTRVAPTIACVLGLSQIVLAAMPLRVATYNVSMYRAAQGALTSELSTPGSAQPRQVAEMIQRVHPDVLLLNEFDYDPTGKSAADFQANYLGVSQNGLSPIHYKYVYTAPSNTGIQPEDVHGPAADFDFNRNGTTDQGDDALGFGEFPGQYGMVVLSKYPIATEGIRTFQQFRWKDMPNAILPDDPATAAPADWYSSAQLDVFRLSSKSHWDVPIDVDGKKIHLLVSHPTPPVFDDVEDRNGTRNHDEIRFWSDYVTPGQSGYIYDDEEFAAAGGQTPAVARGGLMANESFIILGDLNADPNRGDGYPGAAKQLTDNPQINNSFVPTHEDPLPNFDPTTTATFGLRADYVLPSRNLRLVRSGVVWPNRRGDPQIGAASASDHRPVYVDFTVVPEPSTATMVTIGILGTRLGGYRRRNRPLPVVRRMTRQVPYRSLEAPQQ